VRSEGYQGGNTLKMNIGLYITRTDLIFQIFALSTIQTSIMTFIATIQRP
jgi:hypothetical protein